jgi:hypothetical protein
MGTVSVVGRCNFNVQSILARPLMQLGDGDSGVERGGGEKQGGRGGLVNAQTSIKGHNSILFLPANNVNC